MLSLSPNILYCTLTLQIDISFDDGIILFFYQINKRMGFPGGSAVKNLSANAGGEGSSPGWGKCPGDGNGKLIQYSCLGNPMDRGAWRTAVHGFIKNRT